MYYLIGTHYKYQHILFTDQKGDGLAIQYCTVYGYSASWGNGRISIFDILYAYLRFSQNFSKGGSFSNSELQLLAIQETEIKDLVRLPFKGQERIYPMSYGP